MTKIFRESPSFTASADLRGKFRKNLNIDLENSSLLQCKAKTLYYNCLEGFLFEMIFSTVMVELNFSAIRNFSYLS